MKKIIISLAVIGTMFCTNLSAFAGQQIGCVDMTKLLNGYTKAQEINADIKEQQFQIQKMITDARNQVLAVKSKKERDELEKKLTEQIQQRNNSFKVAYEKSVQDLQNNILISVQKVADSKKMDYILKKDNLLIGGEDITDDVLAELNK